MGTFPRKDHSGWQARRLARGHFHHHRGRRFRRPVWWSPRCSWGGSRGSRANSALVLRVGGDLEEVEPGGLVGSFFEPPPTVRSVVEALRKAKVDRRVTSVIIRPTGTAALWGKVQEVRDAIVDFKSSKKPIIAYLEYGGEQEFYLASACDKVFLMPTASLDLTGMASYELFLRGTLDKIGAYPDALHIGEYKTASNTLTEHTFTPAHREMAESLNTRSLRAAGEGHRRPAGRRPKRRSAQLIDHGPFLPEDAVRAGLVDDVAYEDELDDKVSLGQRRRRSSSSTHDYRSVSAGFARPEPRTAHRRALRGRASSARARAATTRRRARWSAPTRSSRYLRKARADDSIKAIVLRIDSPGGSAIASDVIWREVRADARRRSR